MAGGQASRFGGKPKGLEKVGGERIADRALRALQAAVGEPPVVVANAPEAAEWFPGHKIIPDAIPECGALGGLFTAVIHDASPVLVLAWDMPFVTVELLAALRERANAYDVFLPEADNRQGFEPMCAVYGQACARPIKTMLDDEDYRATGFHEHVKVGIMSKADQEAFGDIDKMFFNVNTPADLKKAEDLWRRERG
jgi:molybdopterin-guanine dinucleotide biosynthesis protein A